MVFSETLRNLMRTPKRHPSLPLSAKERSRELLFSTIKPKTTTESSRNCTAILLTSHTREKTTANSCPHKWEWTLSKTEILRARLRINWLHKCLLTKMNRWELKEQSGELLKKNWLLKLQAGTVNSIWSSLKTSAESTLISKNRTNWTLKFWAKPTTHSTSLCIRQKQSQKIPWEDLTQEDPNHQQTRANKCTVTTPKTLKALDKTS